MGLCDIPSWKDKIKKGMQKTIPQMKFIDTHTHIYTEEFGADRDAVVARAAEAGAVALLLPNIDEASLEPMSRLCRQYPDMCFPMMGLHPTELPPSPDPLLDRMEEALRQPSHPYVAVGEVGIDLYWDTARRDEQIAVFRRQAEWSVRYGLPLVVHSRAAHTELVQTLLPLRGELPGGVFHCFGGTAEEARQLLETFPRFVLGIGGVLTFRKSALPEVLRHTVPLERIVVETDAPYLAPVPHRGRRNEPSFVPYVLQQLAQVYDLPAAEVAAVTTATARRVFPRLNNILAG